MATLANLNVLIGAKIRGLEDGLNKAERRLRKTENRLRAFNKIGKTLTASFTLPMVGLVAKSAQLFDIQATAISQVEAGLISTGNAAGKSSEELQAMAAGLQEVTTFGDEDILRNVTAQLITFPNVVEEEFGRAQKVILDISTRMGTDLKSAAIQVGKALNDPVAQLGSLGKAGIQFSKSQKKTIKALVETNKMADAQKIVLAELEKQFGGSAEAAAKAGLGPVKQFQNSMGDVLEMLGKVAMPTIIELTKRLTGLLKKFDNLSEGTKKFIVVSGLAVAAIGPVLLGVSAGIKAFATLRVAVLAVSGPVGWVIGGITALVAGFRMAWQSSARFRGTIIGLGRAMSEVFKVMKESLIAFRDGFKALKSGDFTEAAKQFKKSLPIMNIKDIGKRVGDAYNDGFWEGIQPIEETVKDTGDKLDDLFKKLKENLLGDDKNKNGNGDEDSSNSIIPPFKKIGAAVGVIKRLDGVVGGFKVTTDAATVSVKEMSKGFLEDAKASAKALREEMIQLQQTISTIVEDGITSSFENIGASFGALIAGTSTVSNALVGAVTPLLGILEQVGKLAVKTGVAMLGIKNALKFGSPVGAIGAGVALIALSKLIKGQLGSLAKPMAEGGFVTGPTLALIGEKPGSRGEFVVPFEKMGNFISSAINKPMGNSQSSGFMRVMVEGRLDGQDLLISGEAAQRQMVRSRGF